jgi:Tfp pilus assembly protein PilP
MKLQTAILLLATLTGTAHAQNIDVIQDTRDTLQNTQKKQVIDQNAVLNAAGQGTGTTTAPSTATSAQPAAQASQASAASTAKTPAKAVAHKTKLATKKANPATTAAATDKSNKETPAVAVEDKTTPAEPKKETRSYAAAGRRDPFVSPVVSRSMVTTTCSSGKRCLAIDQIVLTGVIKSDSGMIAVVVNAVNKAYFLRENDPVFNGYVVKITGDSIVFQETVQDNVGKPLTREVTKKITTPAV